MENHYSEENFDLLVSTLKNQTEDYELLKDTSKDINNASQILIGLLNLVRPLVDPQKMTEEINTKINKLLHELGLVTDLISDKTIAFGCESLVPGVLVSKNLLDGLS